MQNEYTVFEICRRGIKAKIYKQGSKKSVYGTAKS